MRTHAQQLRPAPAVSPLAPDKDVVGNFARPDPNDMSAADLARALAACDDPLVREWAHALLGEGDKRKSTSAD